MTPIVVDIIFSCINVANKNPTKPPSKVPSILDMASSTEFFIVFFIENIHTETVYTGVSTIFK